MEDIKRTLMIERINEGLEKIGKKPKPAALSMGLSETAILDILKGRSKNPKRNTLQTLADGFGMSVEYITGGNESALYFKSDDCAVPEHDVSFSAGYGALNEAEPLKGQWVIPDYFLPRNGGDYHIVAVRGDSMEPVLNDGDRVLIDLNDTRPSSSGGLFALYDGMSAVVKRVEFVPNSNPPKIKLISSNQAYSIYEFGLDEVRIIGRVKMIARRVG